MGTVDVDETLDDEIVGGINEEVICDDIVVSSATDDGKIIGPIFKMITSVRSIVSGAPLGHPSAVVVAVFVPVAVTSHPVRVAVQIVVVLHDCVLRGLSDRHEVEVMQSVTV